MGAARGAWARAGLVLVVVLALDQLTKALVRADVAVGEERPVFPAVDLVHVRNRGIAFSFLEDRTAIVVGVIVLAMVALVVWFARRGAARLAWLPAGMLAGGALGNVLDRARLGAVTDFIKLPRWPAFNVADAAITLGVVALVLVIEAEARRRERRERGEATGGAADPA